LRLHYTVLQKHATLGIAAMFIVAFTVFANASEFKATYWAMKTTAAHLKFAQRRFAKF